MTGCLLGIACLAALNSTAQQGEFGCLSSVCTVKGPASGMICTRLKLCPSSQCVMYLSSMRQLSHKCIHCCSFVTHTIFDA